MSQRYGKRRLPSAEDVLRGRVAVTMEQLFELIHLVNPSGMQLTERERAERYATKGRLQSLLLEQHLDALELEADPSAGEDVVTIRHRQNRRDACHAKLAELTPEARFQVQLRRDLAGHEVESPQPVAKPAWQQAPEGEPAPSEASAEELRRRGEAALAEFDFERARTDFRAALQAAILTGPDAAIVQSACQLLELLIDQLAETSEALGWQPRLPQPALADPTLACLLALAAVREGQVELGAQLIAGIEAGRAGEVHVELARIALDLGMLDRCESHLARVIPASEYAAAAQAVLARLQQNKAAAAAEMEQRLPGLLAANQLDAAHALAREILALHPGSESARRILRELAQREQEQRRVAAVRAVEEALAAGSGEHAARLLQAEPGLAGSCKDLEQRVREACAREDLQRRSTLCDQLGALLDEGGGGPAAVEAFWAADELTRAAVREKVHSRELFWIDELGPFAGRTPARTATVVAALVLLEQTTDANQLAELLDKLTAHDGMLRRSTAASRLLQEARSDLDGRRRTAALEQLADIETDIAAANTTELLTARAALAALDERVLAAEDRERLAAVRTRIDAAETAAAQLARFERCLQADDLLGARSAAAALATRADATETALWRGRVDELSERIRIAWIRHAIEGAVVAEHLADFSFRIIHASPPIWLLPGGRQLVLVTGAGQWLFVRLLDLVDTARSSAVVIRTPEPMGHCDWQVDGPTVWITDGFGHVLQIGLLPWDILKWKCLREVRGLPDPIGDCTLVDSRHLWVRTDRPFDKDGDAHSYVVDVESWRLERRVECFVANLIQGSMPPRVAVETAGGKVFLTDARGASVWRADEAGQRLEGVAVHPTGQGVLLLTGSTAEFDDEDKPIPFVLREVGQPEESPSQLQLDDFDGDLVHMVATSLDHGLSYLCYPHAHGTGPNGSLVAIAARDKGLAVASRVPIEEVPFLVQDPQSRQVFSLRADGSRLRTVAIGPDALAAASEFTDCPRLSLLSPQSLHLCRWLSDDSGTELHRLVRLLGNRHDESLDQAIENLLRERSSSRELVTLLLACPPRTSQTTRELIVGRLAAHAEAGDPFAAFGMAESAAGSEQWAKVLEWLAGIEFPGLDPAQQQHVHHLRGFGQLMLGDEAAARESFLFASECESGRCELSDWPDLTAALTEPLEQAKPPGGTSPARSLILAIRSADRALEDGDYAAAIAALDERSAWEVHDAQVLARCAQAWLAVESDEPLHRFRKQLALATFVSSGPHIYNRLELGSRMWPQQRLDDIARQAQQWLET